jgi:hypothetical protein
MERKMKSAPRAKARVTRAGGAKSTAIKPREPSRDEIARRAHELYVKSGYQPGRELEFWLEAERQLRGGVKAKA